MTKRIFRSIICVSLVTILSCFVFIMGILYEYFNNQLITELSNEASIISHGVEDYGDDYLEGLDTNSRITWIDDDGTVLYDSSVDANTLENHADREEFIDAINEGSGSSQRYSSTLAERIVYYAKLMNDGTVMRVCSSQYTIAALLLAMLHPLIFIIIIVVALSIALATMLSKKIVQPINEMDLDSPDIDEDYPEIIPLVKKIRRQNTLIERQITQLKKSEEEFRAITSNMQEGFIIIDAKTDILSYNSGALKLLGKEQAELGESIFLVNRSEPFRNAVGEALNGVHNEKVLERDGRVYQVLANPVFDDTEVCGAVILIMDITEKDQRESLRREFTSNVSHELKTPLTAIYGISEIMQNGIVKPEDMTKFAGDIHNESGRLITLVNDIIKLSRLDENAVFGKKEKVDVYSVAKSNIERLKSTAEENNITVELTGEVTVIDSIPSIVDEIAHNLCENAIKYNKNGGSVSVFVGKDNGRTMLRVSDTGIGIAPEDLNRVFERFYRVDKSHSKKIGGTGLGLSIVKHGAAYLGAKLKAESEEGKGTTITILF